MNAREPGVRSEILRARALSATGRAVRCWGTCRLGAGIATDGTEVQSVLRDALKAQ